MAPHGPADDVVDVQHPAGLFRTDASLVQGEHGPLRDDEQAAQLGEPGDHVVGEGVGGSAAGAGRGGPVDERHHRDGGAARRRGDDVVAAVARHRGRGRERPLGRRAASCALRRRATRRESARNRGPRLRTGAAVAARCSSPSRMRPRRASAVSRISWTRRSNGASWSHCSRYPNASSSGTLLTRCSSSAAWQPRNRRRCAVSQPLKTGLRSISRPSRKSPSKSADSARCRSGASVSMPSSVGAGDLDRIDEAIREIEPDVSSRRVDAPAATARRRCS